MCELLGLCFNLPVQPRISFKIIQRHGSDNPDGWGLAFYPDTSAQIFKDALPAPKSTLANFLVNCDEFKSNIFLAHVRKATKGNKSHMNSHPFSRELNGFEYIFAHNGNLKNYRQLTLGRYFPFGETDSEYIFCYLLNNIAQRGIKIWDAKDFEWLATELLKINEMGKFNCIFSNGDLLFCYHTNTVRDKDTLHYLHRKPPYGKIKLADDDFEINLEEEKGSNQRGYITATRRLTNEDWITFAPGELLVFRKGDMIYSNVRCLDHLNSDAKKSIRDKVAEENAWRCDNFADLERHPAGREFWRDILKWGQNFGRTRNPPVDFPVGPEFIWVGEKYGINTQSIPRILFVGLNPRWDNEMGMRYSLCKIRDEIPWPPKKMASMTADEWDKFRNGDQKNKLTGYREFAHVTGDYSFGTIMNIFFGYNIDGKDILDYIALTNAFVHPGPDEMEKPTPAMKIYEQTQKFLSRVLNILRPDFIFVFAKETWEDHELWGGFWYSGQEGHLGDGDVIYRGRLDSGTQCTAIRIPHFSHFAPNSFKTLIDTAGIGTTRDEILQAIANQFQKSKGK